MTAEPASDRFHPRGTVLERRFMLSMAVVILALMGPAVVIVQFRAAELFQRTTETRAASMARSIAAVVTPSLLSYNYVGLDDAAKGAARDEGIAYVIIHDKEGLIAGDSRSIDTEARLSADPVSTQAVAAREMLVQRVTVRQEGNNLTEALDVAVPVFVTGSSEKWGTVRVGVSLRPIQQAVARLTYSLTALGLVGFLLCLLGARAASRRITRPLQVLREGTLALAQGDLSHRIHIVTGDEIEDLASHFNHMADEIEARQAEAREARRALEALNTSLEEEVRQRTEALRGSEARYRMLVEGSPMGIAVIQNGIVVYGNPAYQKLVGHSSASPIELLTDEDQTEVLDEMAVWDRKEPFGPHEVRIKVTGEPVRHVEMRWMAVDFNGAPADLCLLVDVSAVRKLQEQVAVSDKLRALGELASGVAHDFNNCLAIILGRCQLLSLKTSDAAIQKGLAIIEKAASDGGQTVKRIQDFARMRKDRRAESIDMSDLVTDVVEITRSKWRHEAEGRGVQIQVHTAFHHTAMVVGNAAEFREALTNLVINAVDAMPQGGTLTFETHDDTLAGRPCVRLAVIDTGLGIPEEVIAQVFDPFFSTKGNLGTGLGLSITYGILNRHGGTIEVQSQNGVGTTFTLRFPGGTAEDVPEETAAQDLPFVPASILIVDDEAAIREVLVEGLTAAGYKVTAAAGGREAISRLDLIRFDVLLTDLGMPEVSGWDVVAAARERYGEMILGLVTGWGDTLDPARVRENGVSMVVSKPFELSRLVRDIKQVLLRQQRKAA